MWALGIAALVQAASGNPDGQIAWCDDLRAFKAGLVEMHPNPFHTLSEPVLDAEAERLCNRSANLSDQQMTAEFVRLVASLGEGHSRLELPFDPATGFAGVSSDDPPNVPSMDLLPLRLMKTADGYVVIGAAEENRDLLGARLTSVAGIPVERVMESMLPFVHGDNPANKAFRLSEYVLVPQLLRAAGIPAGETIALGFAPTNGSAVERRLAPTGAGPPGNWESLSDYPNPPDGAKSRSLWIEDIGGGIVHARMTAIENASDYTIEAFASDIAAALDRSGNPTLVLDIRGNPGGNNSLIEPLVRLAIRDERLWRPGRLYVLIDGRTFSAAMNLANAFDRWTPALFVGSPTGASPNSYGDARPLALPASGLVAKISTLYWQDAGPQEERKALEPDVAAPRTQAGLVERRDEALEAVRALASPPAVASGTFSGRAMLFGVETDMTLVVGPSGELSLPKLGVTNLKIPLSASGDGRVESRFEAGPYSVELQARIAGRSMIGWLETQGRYAPFVIEAD